MNSLGNGLAGYMAINILTSTFFRDMLNTFTEGSGMDFSGMYPPNSNLGATALGQILLMTLMEFLFSAIFNTLAIITDDFFIS
ncbi:MAG: hypothetical protein INQ03_24385 [Candidatus Heimdallarchaeota archaeon]|nr:hypothetical protein [Candidatus Heimdallarchaeota archaeon]